VALRMRLLPVPARASSRSISPSTWRVWPSTSAEGSVATCPARYAKPLATTACDMRAPDSIRLIVISSILFMMSLSASRSGSISISTMPISEPAVITSETGRSAALPQALNRNPAMIGEPAAPARPMPSAKPVPVARA